MNKYKIPFQLILFLFFFGVLTIFINSNNVRTFGLMHMGIETLIERGHIYLDGSSSSYRDTFNYNGHFYSSMQPGQYLIGSIIYFLLFKSGLTYKSNFEFIASIVTLFTSVLMTAIVMVLLFNITFNIVKNRMSALLIASFSGFGTLLFSYSGIACYEIYSMFFTFTSFYILFVRYKMRSIRNYLIVAGLFSGISFFVSSKAILAIFLLFLYVCLQRKISDCLLFILGIAVGILPSFMYNYAIFKNIFTFPEAYYASSINIKLIDISFKHILSTLNFYFISPITSIFVFSPIFILGLIGIFFIPKKYWQEKLFIFLFFLATMVQISISTTLDLSNYGPRSLIPAMSFALIGLSGFFVKNKNLSKVWLERHEQTISFVLVIGIISVIINTVGSAFGVMHCSSSTNMFLSYLTNIISGDFPSYPFFNIGIGIVAASVILGSIYHSNGFKKLKLFLTKLNDVYGMSWLYLTLILVIGFVLRIIKIDHIPLGLFVDEAVFGYNAYCISETGRDELGEVLPAFFKVYGYYLSNGVYYYCAAIFIKLFGPTIFALRMTSCVLGLITIFFTYKLTKLYFSKEIALFASFLLSISPWAIHFSRISMDPSSLPPFIVLGLYLFSLGLMQKSKYIIFSALPIGLSFYCYAPARLFIPLLYSCFFTLNLKKIMEKKFFVLTFFAIVLLMLTPFANNKASELQNRFNMISVANSNSISQTKNELKNSILAPYIKDDRIFPVIAFAQNYFKHMSIDFLLKKGDGNLRHNVGQRGQLLWFTFWAGLIGLLYIFTTQNLQNYIFPIWFIIYSIPSSLTIDSIPHAGRSLCGVPVFEILAAVGFFNMLFIAKQLLEKNKLIGIVVSMLIVLFTICGVKDFKNYLHRYFVGFYSDSAPYHDYDVVEILKTTEKMKEFDIFIVPFYIPNYSYLFMHKVNPKEWQKKNLFNKFITNENYIQGDYLGKNVARIDYPGKNSGGVIIGYVYHEITGNVIYEISKVESCKLLDRRNYLPKLMGGLKGEYFNGINFKSAQFVRIDPVVDFFWGNGSPDKSLNSDSFSIKWTGWVNIKEPGVYKFLANSDDGVRLKIDGNNVIDALKINPRFDFEGSANLDSGWHIVVVEFFEAGGGSHMKLEWVTPSGKQEVIPANHLSPDSVSLVGQ